MSQKPENKSQRTEHVVQHQSPPKARNSNGRFLMVCGALSLVGGIALCVGPKLSWESTQIADAAKALGVEGGTLAMGGWILIALGFVRRGQVVATNEVNDESLLLEQVAADLIHVRAGLDEIAERHGSLTDELRLVKSEVESVAQAQRQPQPAAAPAQSGGGEEGLFRLAASLDQLGARMEQRLKAQYDSMQSSLEDLNDVVASVRKNMDEVFQTLGGTEAGEAVPVAVQATADADAAQADVDPDEAQVHYPSQAAKLPPLGVLDTLDDPQPPTANANPAAARPKSALDSSKLAELKALLSDERVLAALDDLRRAGGR